MLIDIVHNRYIKEHPEHYSRMVAVRKRMTAFTS